MSDIDDFQKNNPNTPLGQFVEEEISVPQHTYDPETKRVTIINKLEKQKVMYVHAPKERIRCPDGEHFFVSLNPHKGLFGCTKCSYKRIVYPTKYRFEKSSGSLINRFTGQKI